MIEGMSVVPWGWLRVGGGVRRSAEEWLQRSMKKLVGVNLVWLSGLWFWLSVHMHTSESVKVYTLNMCSHSIFLHFRATCYEKLFSGSFNFIQMILKLKALSAWPILVTLKTIYFSIIMLNDIHWAFLF